MEMWLFIPADKAETTSSWKALAVMAMMGMVRASALLRWRMLAAAVRPSIRGMRMSIRMAL